ncbi:MAG: hypothetical protein WB586_13400 [Chthoniobacterales bacterium]
MKLSFQGYRLWTTDPEPPLRDGHENTWVRVRLTSSISLIPGLEPHRPLKADFYLPWWFIRKSQITFSLEGEDENRREPLEIRVPQVLPRVVPA